MRIYEQAATIEPFGSGLQISPNGIKILEQLGVMPLIKQGLFEPAAIEARIGSTGQQFFYMPLREAAQKRWGATYIHIHRADLIAALCQRVQMLDPKALCLGVKCTAYRKGAKQVALMAGKNVIGQADLLVAADGIHSVLRNQMFGADMPRFTGNVAWRTLVPLKALNHPPPPTGCIWTGRGKHGVTTLVNGGKTVNFVGIVEQDHWHEEGWKIRGAQKEALQDFANFSPILRDIIAQSKDIYRWALHDRAPLPAWSDGPVALLGDAAHPMLPSMAQGSVQALEDAQALAKIVTQHGDISTACQQYFTHRSPRANRVQRLSAQNLRLFHRHSRLAQIATYGPISVMNHLAPHLFYRRYDWLYGG